MPRIEFVHFPSISSIPTLVSCSNRAFDEELRSRNPKWGLRSVDDVARYAILHGFGNPDIHEMQANNLSRVFRSL